MHFPSLNSKIVCVLLAVSTALLILSVILIIHILPSVIENEVHEHVMLKKYTEQYGRFLELPIPITFKVYFFNVENPHDIVNGAKPVVKEVGPYIYKEYRKKNIEAENDTDDTLFYTQRESFQFDVEASGNYSDEDYITMLNAPLIKTVFNFCFVDGNGDASSQFTLGQSSLKASLQEGMAQTAEDMKLGGVISRCLREMFPSINKIFIKVKVKDILFDGVKFCPSNVTFLCVLPCTMAATKKNVDKLENNDLKFSLFNYKVRSDDGLYRIKRGIRDEQSLGHIVSLNNLTHTNFWKNDSTCDEVKGTDATLYPPKISKNAVFQIYSTDICRYVEIRFLKEKRYKGINGYLFATDNSTLRSKTSQARDDCFCVNKTKGIDGEPTCFLNGVIDLQPCVGAPVLLSFPHFLWADQEYAGNVDGLAPNEDLHKTYLIVEPNTGTPLKGVTRIQMNVVLRPIDGLKRTQNLSRAVLPLLWVEEGALLNDEYVEKLNNMYFEKVKFVDFAKWTFLGVSTVLIIISGSYLIYKQCS